MIIKRKLLGITIEKFTKNEVLEKIKKYLQKPTGFFHIVSLNPENLVIAQENREFRKVLETAQIKLIDGVGIVMAAQILNIPVGERMTGVDLMEELIELAGKMRLRVLFIGGRGDLAENIAKCYQKRFSEAEFLGTMGFLDIKNPKKTEEKKVFDIVRRYKPHIVLVAFGSPYQELWIEHHKDKFNKMLCMGVGQGFDVAGKKVKRAPKWIQNIGFEWLYRLITQPWRWRRQLRLVRFLWLIFLSGFNIFVNKMFFFSNKTFFDIASEIIVNLISGWIAILLSPLVFDEKYDINQYFFILTKGIIFSIIGLLISFWLREKSKKYELGKNN